MSAKAGEIFFCPKFTFKDHKAGKKFLVLLNTPVILQKAMTHIYFAEQHPNKRINL